MIGYAIELEAARELSNTGASIRIEAINRMKSLMKALEIEHYRPWDTLQNVRDILADLELQFEDEATK